MIFELFVSGCQSRQWRYDRSLRFDYGIVHRWYCRSLPAISHGLNCSSEDDRRSETGASAGFKTSIARYGGVKFVILCQHWIKKSVQPRFYVVQRLDGPAIFGLAEHEWLILLAVVFFSLIDVVVPVQ